MNKLMQFDANVRDVFDNDEAKYESFNKLMLDVANNSLEEGISLKEANAKITQKFREITGLNEKSSRSEVRKAIRRNQTVLFELIETVIPNMLQTGWADNPFFMEWVEQVNTDIGDQNIFTVDDNSILEVAKVSGNHWDVDRVKLGKGQSFSIPTSWYAIAVYEEYERLLIGSDFSKFVTKLYEACDRFVNESIYQAVMDAEQKLPGGASGSGQWVKTGELNTAGKATFMQLIEDVQMATGMEVVIMGTKVALSKLEGMQDINWISNDMKTERNTLGMLGYFEGIRLVEIKQGFRQNDTSNRLVDDKKLLIMPVGDNKFIKYVSEGEPEMRQVNDNTIENDMTYSYTYQFKMGVGVVINMLFGVWNIT